MTQEWKLVPVHPTDNMVINGFESEPDECFTDEKVWEQYQQMTGCQQAAFRAKLCWAAMLAAAPVPPAGDLPERMDAPSRDEYELECYWAAAMEQAKAHNDCLDACLPIVTRLQAEKAALQQRLNTADQRVDELERKAKLYDQLQRGAELLPEGWMITVEVERDGGGVTLIDPQGNDLDYPSNRESMGDEVEDAIEEALAQQVAL